MNLQFTHLEERKRKGPGAVITVMGSRNSNILNAIYKVIYDLRWGPQLMFLGKLVTDLAELVKC